MLRLPHQVALPLLALPALASAASTASNFDEAVAQAKSRWATSPHGPMLERILPPTFAPSALPQPESTGARLAVRYCVQCHNLPNPAMHQAEKWPKIVDRMVLRMQGRGNLGPVMSDMMADVAAPTEAETATLLAWLRANAMQPLDPARYPDLESPQAQSFRVACSQCHALPDPQRHTAREWSAVVERMLKNMAWMNRVVGSRADPDEPQLRVDEIKDWLARNARK